MCNNSFQLNFLEKLIEWVNYFKQNPKLAHILTPHGPKVLRSLPSQISHVRIVIYLNAKSKHAVLLTPIFHPFPLMLERKDTNGSEFPSYPSLQANLMPAHAAFAVC